MFLLVADGFRLWDRWLSIAFGGDHYHCFSNSRMIFQGVDSYWQQPPQHAADHECAHNGIPLAIGKNKDGVGEEKQ